MCVCMHTHQEDQVGLLVKGSGDADPLFLPTRQDDPLRETAMNYVTSNISAKVSSDEESTRHA